MTVANPFEPASNSSQWVWTIARSMSNCWVIPIVICSTCLGTPVWRRYLLNFLVNYVVGFAMKWQFNYQVSIMCSKWWQLDISLTIHYSGSENVDAVELNVHCSRWDREADQTYSWFNCSVRNIISYVKQYVNVLFRQDSFGYESRAADGFMVCYHDCLIM